MFIEINHHTLETENLKALIKTDDIVGITENEVEPTRLYDGDGNLVSETPSPRDFKLHLATGKSFHIDETQYQELVKILTSTNA